MSGNYFLIVLITLLQVGVKRYIQRRDAHSCIQSYSNIRRKHTDRHFSGQSLS